MDRGRVRRDGRSVFTDHRVSRVYLTPQGEAARVQAEAVWGELEAELRTALNAEEQAQLVALLRKVRAALDQERA